VSVIKCDIILTKTSYDKQYEEKISQNCEEILEAAGDKVAGNRNRDNGGLGRNAGDDLPPSLHAKNTT